MSIKAIRVTKHPLPQPMVRLVQGDANSHMLRFMVKKDYGGKDLTDLIWSVWVQGYWGETEVSYIGNSTVDGDDIILDWEIIPAVAKDPGITIIKLYGSNAGAAEKEYAWVSGNMQILVTPTQLIDPGYDENEVNEIRQLIEDFNEHENAVSAETDAKLEAQKEYVDGKINEESHAREAAVAQLENGQNVLSGRIDSIFSLPDGSTTLDGLLLDINVGADGVTYENPGDAVRTQFANLKNYVDSENTAVGNSVTTVSNRVEEVNNARQENYNTLSSRIDGKQSIISDLSTIRSNAANAYSGLDKRPIAYTKEIGPTNVKAKSQTYVYVNFPSGHFGRIPLIAATLTPGWRTSSTTFSYTNVISISIWGVSTGGCYVTFKSTSDSDITCGANLIAME